MSDLSRNLLTPRRRAELTLSLLRRGDFALAEEAALPLVGTAYQAWFLYARAWTFWTDGRAEKARTTLNEVFRLLGSQTPSSVVFALTSQGARIHREMELGSSGTSTPRRPRLPREITETKVIVGDLSPSLYSRERLSKMFRHLQPLIPTCVSGYSLAASAFQPECLPEDKSWLFLCERMATRAKMEEFSRDLWRLHQLSGPNYVLTTLSSFMLILAERYQEVLHITESTHQKHLVLGNLRALAHYRLGNRHNANEMWGRLMAEYPKRSITPFFLGLLCLTERRMNQGLRYLHEALLRDPSEPVLRECFSLML